MIEAASIALQSRIHRLFGIDPDTTDLAALLSATLKGLEITRPDTWSFAESVGNLVAAANKPAVAGCGGDVPSGRRPPCKVGTLEKLAYSRS